MLVRLTVTTVQTTFWAACLSARVRGFTASTAAVIMGEVTTDEASTGGVVSMAADAALKGAVVLIAATSEAVIVASMADGISAAALEGSTAVGVHAAAVFTEAVHMVVDTANDLNCAIEN
jgi:hypothetical protein